MKPLLPFNSPTYLRRLARELNRAEHGFYCTQGRFARASFVKGQITVTDHFKTVAVEAPNDETFWDHNGRPICARRQT